MATAAAYVLGHSEAELQRLATQARLIDPITRRFLTTAGISTGMRVLDVGSGAGDVAMLIAAIVGPEGEVVGTDTSATAVRTAEDRVQAGGIANITFRHGDPADMIFDKPFDAVAGRYVLQFMGDPSNALARLACHLSPGGLIVFHELDWDGARSVPCVPTYDRACDWAKRTIELGLAQSRIGPKMASLFGKAGLPSATMQLESVIAAGPAALDVIHLVVDLVGTLLTTMERLGVATAQEIDIATLADRIAEEVGDDFALIGRAEVAAWARL